MRVKRTESYEKRALYKLVNFGEDLVGLRIAERKRLVESQTSFE